jgi:hypothetical protein
MTKTELSRLSQGLHRIISEGIKYNDWKYQAHIGISELIDCIANDLCLSATERAALLPNEKS